MLPPPSAGGIRRGRTGRQTGSDSRSGTAQRREARRAWAAGEQRREARPRVIPPGLRQIAAGKAAQCSSLTFGGGDRARNVDRLAACPTASAQTVRCGLLNTDESKVPHWDYTGLLHRSQRQIRERAGGAI